MIEVISRIIPALTINHEATIKGLLM